MWNILSDDSYDELHRGKKTVYVSGPIAFFNKHENIAGIFGCSGCLIPIAIFALFPAYPWLGFLAFGLWWITALTFEATSKTVEVDDV